MYDWKNRHHDYYCFEDDISTDMAPWEVMATAMREI
jgi:hypothetical protein